MILIGILCKTKDVLCSDLLLQKQEQRLSPLRALHQLQGQLQVGWVGFSCCPFQDETHEDFGTVGQFWDMEIDFLPGSSTPPSVAPRCFGAKRVAAFDRARGAPPPHIFPFWKDCNTMV